MGKNAPANYWLVIGKVQTKDTGCEYWQKHLNIEIDREEWIKVQVKTFKARFTWVTKLRYFQYRVLSGKLTTNYIRNKWDKNVDSRCVFCKNKN